MTTWRKRAAKPVACGMLAALVALASVATGCHRHAMTSQPPERKTGPYVWHLPPGFPKPKIPEDNPMTYEKVALGRRLFYDKRLAQNNNQSCGDCHQQARAFTDGLPRGVGSTGELNARGAQSLANVAYLTSYTWASSLMQTLEVQAMTPIFGRKPIELGELDVKAFVDKFAQDAMYQRMFADSYPGDKTPVTLQHLVQAIACFERTIISGDAPYDRYFFRGDTKAISQAAKDGANLFFSERLECNHCHSGFHFMDATQHDKTRIPNLQYHNTALYNVDGKGSYPPTDTGLREVTTQAGDMGRFRAQTMRNIMVTAPYFHDGSAQTIDDVLAHYMAGGRTLTGEWAGDGSQSPLKSQFMIGFTLSDEERAQLHAFFDSLTDETLLHNPELSNPWPGAETHP